MSCMSFCCPHMQALILHLTIRKLTLPPPPPPPRSFARKKISGHHHRATQSTLDSENAQNSYIFEFACMHTNRDNTMAFSILLLLCTSFLPLVSPFAAFPMQESFYSSKTLQDFALSSSTTGAPGYFQLLKGKI